jgi:hypothetical protein
MDKIRSDDLLSYVNQGATDEDLVAAGFSDEEIAQVFEGMSQPEQEPFVAQAGDTIAAYKPTRRQNVGRNIQESLKGLGLPEGNARSVAEGVAGTGPNTLGMGLADFSPLGLVFGVEEGIDQFKRGQNSDSKTDMAMGAGIAGLSVLGAVPGVGLAAKGISKLGKKMADNYDPSVVSAMGAQHRASRYPPRQAEATETLDADGTPKGWGGVDTSNPNTIQFQNPIDEILAEMEIPAQGLKGSQLIKDLELNSSVRSSQLRSQGILEGIDPQARYNKDEITELLNLNSYKVEGFRQAKYPTYQRQFDLADEEVNYVEYTIEANPTKGGQTKFVANSQHYGPNTLSHIRMSERRGTESNYVLIEELQSDLLQQGFLKPANESVAIKNALEEKALLREFHRDQYHFDVARRITSNDLSDFLKVDDLSSKADFIRAFGKKEYLGPNQLVDALAVFNKLAARIKVVTHPDLTIPPIAKTEEGVRLAMEAAMAYAQKKGITKIVIPPLRKIAEKRFPDDPVSMAKAMDPKNGFYQTYVNSVNRFAKDLQTDFGDNAVSVGEFDLKYDPNHTGFEFDFDPEDFVGGGINAPTARPANIFAQDFTDMFAETFLRTTGRAFPTQFGQKAARRYADILRRSVEYSEDDFDLLFAMQDMLEGIFNSTAKVDALRNDIKEGMSFQEAYAKAAIPELPPPPQLVTEKGLVIDFSGLKEQNLDLSKPKFAEGGMVLNQPSQKPVPPGAMAKEVADDVDIKASEGEYILPANVVRFLGLDKIEKMVAKAKEQLAGLDEQGRIGGDTGEDELPFALEELLVNEAPAPAPQSVPQMAAGGLIAPQAPTPPSMTIDPVTGLPTWGVPAPTTPAPVAAPPRTRGVQERESTDDNKNNFEGPYKGLPVSVDKWSPEQFNRFADQRNTLGQALGQTAMSGIPLGGLAVKARQNYLEKNVPTKMKGMLDSKTDLQGNALSSEQLSSLKTSYDKVTTETRNAFGVRGVVQSAAQKAGLIQKREVTPNADGSRKRGGIIGDLVGGLSRTKEERQEARANRQEARSERQADKREARSERQSERSTSKSKK